MQFKITIKFKQYRHRQNNNRIVVNYTCSFVNEYDSTFALVVSRCTSYFSYLNIRKQRYDSLL